MSSVGSIPNKTSVTIFLESDVLLKSTEEISNWLLSASNPKDSTARILSALFKVLFFYNIQQL